MKTKDRVLKLIAGDFTCSCGSTEFKPRKSATLYCARCGRANFEAGCHFARVLIELVDPDLKPERRYMHRLLAKDWKKCPDCGRRFKALQKHIDKKHGDLFPEPEKDLFE